jgi:hypothetical protein
MEIRRQDNPPTNKTAFTISNIPESLIKHGVTRINFDDCVVSIDFEDVSIASATHAEESTVLAAIAKFIGVACGGTNKDLAGLPKRRSLVKSTG